MTVNLHSLLTSKLDGRKGSAPRFGCCKSGYKSTVTTEWEARTAGVGALGKRTPAL